MVCGQKIARPRPHRADSQPAEVSQPGASRTRTAVLEVGSHVIVDGQECGLHTPPGLQSWQPLPCPRRSAPCPGVVVSRSVSMTGQVMALSTPICPVSRADDLWTYRSTRARCGPFRVRAGEQMAASVGWTKLASSHPGLEAGAGLKHGHQLGNPPPVGAQRGAQPAGGRPGASSAVTTCLQSSARVSGVVSGLASAFQESASARAGPASLVSILGVMPSWLPGR